MKVKKVGSRGIGWQLKCANGHYQEGTIGTFLQHWRVRQLHLNFGTCLEIIMYFLNKIPITVVMSEMEIGAATAVEWYDRCRRVMRCVVNHHQASIGGGWLGGPGDIVEIDESLIRRRKANTGRLSNARSKGQWVFGGKSRTTKQVFACIVRNRMAATLLPILGQHVHRLSFVCSNKWSAYRQVGWLYRGHGVVNHSVNFVNPPRTQPPFFVLAGTFNRECLDETNAYPVPPGVEPVRFHTQNGERSWRPLKKTLKTTRTVSRQKDYIGEYMYRQNILSSHMDKKLEKFLADIGLCYPGPTKRIMSPVMRNCRCHICSP